MSDNQDEDANSISPSPSHSSDLDDENETENGYESNDTDSLNLDEEEEEDDGGSFPIPCLSDRLVGVGGSLVLHIDQTGPPTSAPGSLNLGANQSSTSTATSLSDTASENTSIRAVLGDTPSTTEANMLPTGDEDGGDNSSQVSTVDSEAERVRRIHNSIFNSLENDLAELVRIREETIQFLETGVRSGSFNGESGEAEDGGSGDGEQNADQNQDQNVPFALRERLTYYTRPFSSGENSQQFVDASTTTSDGGAGAAVVSTSNMAALQARSYTPIAKFDNASPGKPAKPYVEVGLTSCDEKASAARKILDKLQYGDPEDEGACFVRRFWRETSTVVENTPSAPLSLDVAAIAQRTASLQASLEEAFDGLRLRLQQARTPDSTTGPDTSEGGPRESGGGGDADNNGGREHGSALIQTTASSDYQNWDRETSIMNDPLNYDIWNELEDGHEAGPTITARINLAERRAIASTRNRRTSIGQRSSREESTRSTTVAVGTSDNGPGNLEGAELDDESTDDEEMLSYFHFRCNNDPRNSDTTLQNRPHNLPSNMNQESREFFRDIGISDEMGQDLLNMFTFSEEDVQVPSDIQMEENSDMNNYEIPQPLFPRDSNNRNSPSYENQEDAEDNEPNNNQLGLPSEMDDDNDNSSPPQIPLMDDTPCIHIAPNREDECSTRVYLDENYLDFPFNRGEDEQNGNLDQQ